MTEASRSVILWEVIKYLDTLQKKHIEKIEEFMRLLEARGGILEYPLSSHLEGKIRELRIGLGRFEHRVLYALLPGREILLITAFLKKTQKMPRAMIDRAKYILGAYLKNKIKNK